ncbi:MAG: hypothetical protein II883_06830 [Spirochaetales bacterium]|nr:hypothetical protein [Spirochaetales bacterium]MCR5442188.1 hypothetical protein [Sphaerochaetaceae bacterium]MBQ3697619.1 hypothetical protein [Spirochaetales bacterium]MBQ3728004.1 hypothetical protein [Spirochaetales bacterium]MBQ3830303.1 hypothetical protein [Spirochaetales bacterium]
MGKASRKFAGFLWALIIAIVSFFVIFFFFPDVSYKFFGTAGRVNKEKVSKAVDEAVSTVGEAVSEAAKDAISNAAEKASEVVK